MKSEDLPINPNQAIDMLLKENERLQAELAEAKHEIHSACQALQDEQNDCDRLEKELEQAKAAEISFHRDHKNCVSNFMALEKELEQARLKCYAEHVPLSTTNTILKDLKQAKEREMDLQRRVCRKCDDVESANARLTDLLREVLASAVPNPKEHPTMWDAWKKAEAALTVPPTQPQACARCQGISTEVLDYHRQIDVPPAKEKP